MTYTHPPCPVCDGPIERRCDERPSLWKDRQTCSPGCATIHRQTRKRQILGLKPLPKERVTRYCTICGTRLARGAFESAANFYRRVACHGECAAIYRAQRYGRPAHAVNDRPVSTEEMVEIDYGAGFGGQDVNVPEYGKAPPPGDARTYGGVQRWTW